MSAYTFTSQFFITYNVFAFTKVLKISMRLGCKLCEPTALTPWKVETRNGRHFSYFVIKNIKFKTRFKKFLSAFVFFSFFVIYFSNLYCILSAFLLSFFYIVLAFTSWERHWTLNAQLFYDLGLKIVALLYINHSEKFIHKTKKLWSFDQLSCDVIVRDQTQFFSVRWKAIKMFEHIINR